MRAKGQRELQQNEEGQKVEQRMKREWLKEKWEELKLGEEEELREKWEELKVEEEGRREEGRRTEVSSVQGTPQGKSSQPQPESYG